MCAVCVACGWQVIAQMGLWTAGFVLMSLLLNGPLIAPLMTWLGINKPTAAKQQVRGPLCFSIDMLIQVTHA